MADVTWYPTDGGELFNLPETDGPISYTIYAEAEDEDTGEPLTVSGYEYTLTPEDEEDVLNITATDDGVTIEADTLEGLFPIVHIDYLLDRVEYRIDTWDDLPDDAEEVVEFEPSDEVRKVFDLVVTANAGGSQIEQTWELIVTQDWTSDRDRLQEEVDARR